MRLRKKRWALPELEQSYIFRFRPAFNKGKWNEDFNNDNDIVLELGSGMGSFINFKCKYDKSKNYIGADMEDGCLVYAKRLLEQDSPQNVRLMLCDIRNIDEYFDEDEVSMIYINFPNPWPKNRHHKRRLIYPEQLKKYKKILKNDALIRFKTDDYNLFKSGLDYFSDEGYEILFQSDNLDADFYENDFISEYERKWRALNVPIKSILAKNRK